MKAILVPAAADPAEGFAFEVGRIAAEEGAELAGVVLDVADAHQVQFAAGAKVRSMDSRA
jgi:hypothetical protein